MGKLLDQCWDFIKTLWLSYHVLGDAKYVSLRMVTVRPAPVAYSLSLACFILVTQVEFPEQRPTPVVCQWPCAGGGSPTKRGRLAVDVSSERIFLSKKKKRMVTIGFLTVSLKCALWQNVPFQLLPHPSVLSYTSSISSASTYIECHITKS